MTKIAISQSNYIPWKGYFDLIASVDHFILYDDMQYTRRDWRNRNIIKTPAGPQWLTVPVKVKGKYHQTIRETELSDPSWSQKHWHTLAANYRRAPFFKEIAAMLEPHFLTARYTHLVDLNHALIRDICGYLRIMTKISDSAEFTLIEGRTSRLVDLCAQAGGTEYVSGPAAKNYIEPHLFQQKGIQLTWFQYDDYPEYSQLWGPFTHTVSIVDLLFHCGTHSGRYMKYIRS